MRSRENASSIFYPTLGSLRQRKRHFDIPLMCQHRIEKWQNKLQTVKKDSGAHAIIVAHPAKYIRLRKYCVEMKLYKFWAKQEENMWKKPHAEIARGFQEWFTWLVIGSPGIWYYKQWNMKKKNLYQIWRQWDYRLNTILTLNEVSSNNTKLILFLENANLNENHFSSKVLHKSCEWNGCKWTTKYRFPFWTIQFFILFSFSLRARQ